MIETYVLEHLAAVGKFGTFSKAAEELNTSQPTITRSMQKIEDELGVKLFDRTKNRISLNELGIEASRYAKSIVDMQNTMIASIRDMDKRRHTFTFAAPAPAPIRELSPIFSQLFNDKEVASELRLIKNILTLLDKKEIDLAVTIEPTEKKDYFCVPFMKENLSVLLPKNHKLADRAKTGLYLEDLAGETFLLFSAVGFWHDIVQTKIPDAQFIIQNEYGTLGTLIDASSLPSFITNITRTWRPISNDRVIVPLNDKIVHITFYAVFRIEDRWKYENLIDTLAVFYKTTMVSPET